MFGAVEVAAATHAAGFADVADFVAVEALQLQGFVELHDHRRLA